MAMLREVKEGGVPGKKSKQDGEKWSLPVWRESVVSEGEPDLTDVSFYTYAAKDEDPVFAAVGTGMIFIFQYQRNSTLGKSKIKTLFIYKDDEIKGSIGDQDKKRQSRAIAWARQDDGLPLLCISGPINTFIKVINPFTGEQIQTLIGHGKAINALATSPSQPHILASAADDKNIYLWSLAKAHQKAPCVAVIGGWGHIDRILCLAWHSTGKWLLSGGFDNRVSLWLAPEYPDPKAPCADWVAEVVNMPYFCSSEVHDHPVERVAFYDDTVISHGATEPYVSQWRITGFSSVTPTELHPTKPTFHDEEARTRSAWEFADNKDPLYRRLLRFDIPTKTDETLEDVWHLKRRYLDFDIYIPSQRVGKTKIKDHTNATLAVCKGFEVRFWDFKRLITWHKESKKVVEDGKLEVPWVVDEKIVSEQDRMGVDAPEGEQVVRRSASIKAAASTATMISTPARSERPKKKTAKKTVSGTGGLLSEVAAENSSPRRVPSAPKIHTSSKAARKSVKSFSTVSDTIVQNAAEEVHGAAVMAQSSQQNQYRKGKKVSYAGLSLDGPCDDRPRIIDSISAARKTGDPRSIAEPDGSSNDRPRNEACIPVARRSRKAPRNLVRTYSSAPATSDAGSQTEGEESDEIQPRKSSKTERNFVAIPRKRRKASQGPQGTDEELTRETAGTPTELGKSDEKEEVDGDNILTSELLNDEERKHRWKLAPRSEREKRRAIGWPIPNDEESVSEDSEDEKHVPGVTKYDFAHPMPEPGNDEGVFFERMGKRWGYLHGKVYDYYERVDQILAVRVDKHGLVDDNGAYYTYPYGAKSHDDSMEWSHPSEKIDLNIQERAGTFYEQSYQGKYFIRRRPGTDYGLELVFVSRKGNWGFTRVGGEHHYKTIPFWKYNERRYQRVSRDGTMNPENQLFKECGHRAKHYRVCHGPRCDEGAEHLTPGIDFGVEIFGYRFVENLGTDSEFGAASDYYEGKEQSWPWELTEFGKPGPPRKQILLRLRDTGLGGNATCDEYVQSSSSKRPARAPRIPHATSAIGGGESDSDEEPISLQAMKTQRGRKQDLTDDPSKRHVCEHCSRRLGRLKHLKRHHLSVHEQVKPSKCRECGKRFTRKDNLTQYFRVHKSGGPGVASRKKGELKQDDTLDAKMHDHVASSDEEGSEPTIRRTPQRRRDMGFGTDGAGSGNDRGRARMRRDLLDSRSAGMEESCSCGPSPQKISATSNLASAVSGIGITDVAGAAHSDEEPTDVDTLLLDHTKQNKAPADFAADLDSSQNTTPDGFTAAPDRTQKTKFKIAAPDDFAPKQTGHIPSRRSLRHPALVGMASTDASGDEDLMENDTVVVASKFNTTKTPLSGLSTENASANSSRRSSKRPATRQSTRSAVDNDTTMYDAATNDLEDKRCHSCTGPLSGKWCIRLPGDGNEYLCHICWTRDCGGKKAKGNAKKKICCICSSTQSPIWHQHLHNEARPSNGKVFCKKCHGKDYREKMKHGNAVEDTLMEPMEPICCLCNATEAKCWHHHLHEEERNGKLYCEKCHGKDYKEKMKGKIGTLRAPVPAFAFLAASTFAAASAFTAEKSKKRERALSFDTAVGDVTAQSLTVSEKATLPTSLDKTKERRGRLMEHIVEKGMKIVDLNSDSQKTDGCSELPENRSPQRKDNGKGKEVPTTYWKLKPKMEGWEKYFMGDPWRPLDAHNVAQGPSNSEVARCAKWSPCGRILVDVGDFGVVSVYVRP